MKDPIYHPLSSRSFPPPGGRVRERARGLGLGLGARSLLFLLFLLFLTLPLSAQRFFNLTNDQVRIDSTLPRFTYTIALPADYADSVYTPSILYPEFVDMAQSDIEAYHRLSSEPLPTLPAIEQQVVMNRRRPNLQLSFCPLVYRNGRYQILASFMLRVDAKAVTAATRQMAKANIHHAPLNTDRYASHSVLASGRWVKIRVPASGIYQLSSSLVRQAGFSDINKVKIYGYGGNLQDEVLNGNTLKALDDLPEVEQCIVGGKHLFYAKGPVSWSSNTAAQRTRNFYSDYGYYFLTESNDAVATVDSTTFLEKHYPTADDYHSLYEVDGFSWYHGGRNLFDSETISKGNTKRLVLSNLSKSKTGKLSVAVTAGQASTAQIMLNDSVLGTMSINLSGGEYNDYNKGGESYATYAINTLHANDTVKIMCTDGGPLRLDYVSMAWSNPAPKPNLTSTFPTPSLVGTIANQDHHADTATDMVIIIPTSGKYLEQAQRLASFHEQHDSLRVRIVKADELYNEFSSGTPDANAYRRYLKMLYDRATTDADLPRYLLLFGRGVWDNRMLTSDCRGLNADDYLLCHESENSLNAVLCYVDDGFFTRLDDGEGGNPLTKDMDDIAVGRFPVTTVEEAKTMVDKTIAYAENSNAGAWQNELMFMGDDGNNNLHMNDENENADYIEALHPEFVLKKVMWDAYTEQASATGHSYPEVSAIIKRQQQNGALIMDYAGHGSAGLIAHEGVLKLSDFQNFSNTNLPLWITASCDIMAFDDVEDNIGTAAVVNANGGAVAFFGTTRTVLASYNKLINRAFLTAVLSRKDGKALTLGEAQQQAKNQMITTGQDRTVNKLQYSLLGDPALRLNLPEPCIVVDSINGIPTTSATRPKFKAGSIARIAGHVNKADAENFSGVATIVVRDSQEKIVCKENYSAEADSAFVFYSRNKILYTGSDSIRKGRFAFTFSVPMDINYSDNTGLVNVYAVNNEHTSIANGVSDHFTVGGSITAAVDTIGPKLFCYLNTPEFQNGGTVNCTPYFVAEISDTSGINATGNGIGHDLQLIIDGDANKVYSLNDEFTYDFGSYTSGRTAFSIPSLEPGKHTLTFRAWDILNNSSTATLDFVVTKSLQPTISSVGVSKNPAYNTTTFIVNHDMAGSKVDVCIEVFDMSGRTLWKHTDTGVTNLGTYTKDWDLCDGQGCRLQTGVYLYRVRMCADGSSYASKTQKLIIIRQ